MKPREVTQEDVDFWNNNDEGITYEIQPMRGRHLGAADIPAVLLGRDALGSRQRVKVAWIIDERDNVPSTWPDEPDTVWTTFFGGMPPTDVVML